MSKRIDEIMQINGNGYIEEHGDIEVIMEYFLNYTVEELNNALSKNCNIYHFSIGVMQKLDDIEISDSSQIENCCLLHKRLFIDGIATYYYTNFNFFEFLEKYNLTKISTN